MSESEAAAVETTDAPIETVVVDPETSAAEPSESQEGPASPDPRDVQMAEQAKLIDRLTEAIVERERGSREPAPSAPTENPLEAEARRLGFGNVGATDTSPGVNMIPGLMKLFEMQRGDVLGTVERAVSPRLSAIGAEIVGTKFERALAVRVQKQTPEFLAFRDAQIKTDAALGVMRREAPEIAAELIDARWREQRRDVKKGEERRTDRLSGAALQGASPRGGNGTETVFKIDPNDPNLAQRLCEAAENPNGRIEWTKKKRA